MAKRKREVVDDKPVKAHKASTSHEKPQKATKTSKVQTNGARTIEHIESPSPKIQIVVGSYEKALHGFTATIPAKRAGNSNGDHEEVKFADTFLFNAHSSAIRCLAISQPTEGNDKVTLASGSTDERINLFQLSTASPADSENPKLPALSGTAVSENRLNKELGALLHHASSVTALYFPNRSKLLSSSEDNTIAVSRTRDWTVMSTIKAPMPKAMGRPSGDTAAPGEVPAGVNDFAVHPSMKLMVSVGKGEKCMRLWNLVTARKAAVLQFDRDTLQQAGEGKYSSGEGRKVEWDAEGEEFTVAFERGAVTYGLDSKPRCVILPSPRTKIHQIRYLPNIEQTILAVSTEDGRIMFYRTDVPEVEQVDKSSKIPSAILVAQLGGPAAGIAGRFKDFDVLPCDQIDSVATRLVFITGSSDGAVRMWTVPAKDLQPSSEDSAVKQVGRLAGTYETGHRITCLKSFIMTGKPDKQAENGRAAKERGDASSDDGSDDSD